jgi:hypothetical protein
MGGGLALPCRCELGRRPHGRRPGSGNCSSSNPEKSGNALGCELVGEPTAQGLVVLTGFGLRGERETPAQAPGRHTPFATTCVHRKTNIQGHRPGKSIPSASSPARAQQTMCRPCRARRAFCLLPGRRPGLAYRRAFGPALPAIGKLHDTRLRGAPRERSIPQRYAQS